MLLARIFTYELRFHIDTRQQKLIHRDLGDLVLVQLIHQGDRFEGMAYTLQVLVELLTRFIAQLQHLDHLIEHLRGITGALAGQGQIETGSVIGQYHAIAVVDHPALRRDRQHVHPVVFGYRGVVGELDDLQEVQTPYQGNAQGQHQQRAGDQPTVDQALFLAMIFERDGLGHADRSEKAPMVTKQAPALKRQLPRADQGSWVRRVSGTVLRQTHLALGTDEDAPAGHEQRRDQRADHETVEAKHRQATQC